MPDTPDFEQLAWRLKNFVDDHPSLADQNVRAIAAQLREVWNARGAADIARIEADLASMMGPTAAGPYVKNLDRAIRKLDQ